MPPDAPLQAQDGAESKRGKDQHGVVGHGPAQGTAPGDVAQVQRAGQHSAGHQVIATAAVSA